MLQVQQLFTVKVQECRSQLERQASARFVTETIFLRPELGSHLSTAYCVSAMPQVFFYSLLLSLCMSNILPINIQYSPI